MTNDNVVRPEVVNQIEYAQDAWDNVVASAGENNPFEPFTPDPMLVEREGMDEKDFPGLLDEEIEMLETMMVVEVDDKEMVKMIPDADEPEVEPMVAKTQTFARGRDGESSREERANQRRSTRRISRSRRR